VTRKQRCESKKKKKGRKGFFFPAARKKKKKKKKRGRKGFPHPKDEGGKEGKVPDPLMKVT